MRGLIVYIVLYAVLACSQSAAASSWREAAKAYEECIIGLKNLSIDEIKKAGSGGSFEGVDRIAQASVNSCHKEREELVDELKNSGEYNDRRIKMISELEIASMFAIKVHTANMYVNGGYRSN